MTVETTAVWPYGRMAVTRSCMKASADCGGVSRPSRNAWIATGRPARRPSSTAASRCVSSACTPPVPIRLIRCSVPFLRRISSHNFTNGSSRKNSPDSMLCEMRTMSCGTTRPAPRFRCPTSLLPICPSGSPTARPDASSNVRGARSHRRCQTGVAPSSMALPSRPGRNPQPSRTIRTTGVRAPRRVLILEGMQCSRALCLIPVALWVGVAAPVVAQQRWRVANDGAWFYQTAGGKRLARLARGAILIGAVKDDWAAVTMEGWIFAASVGTTDRDGYNLAVTRAPEENLRSAPAGALVDKLTQGFLLSRVDTSDRWVHVRRDGFVSKDDLELIPETVQAPGLRPGVTDSGAARSAAPPAPDTTRRTPSARSPRAAPPCTAPPTAPPSAPSRPKRRCASSAAPASGAACSSRAG